MRDLAEAETSTAFRIISVGHINYPLSLTVAAYGPASGRKETGTTRKS